MREETNTQLTPKDFASEVEVKWCPGCGDYVVLAQLRQALAELNRRPESVVLISGIGCAARLPYYMNTYGFHTIHGRPFSVATGLRLVRPDLNIWVITGDGDALSIGAGHLLHTLRRNVNLNILLFNNRVYGLTKGQYSPTSEVGMRTPSSPYGSIDWPINPIALALAADATFVARTIDANPKHLRETFKAADLHHGTSFVEIYQNCKVFNDAAFAPFAEKQSAPLHSLYLEAGQPLRFGVHQEKVILWNHGNPQIVDSSVQDYDPSLLWIHDPQDKVKAFLLSQFGFSEPFSHFPVPFGVLYQTQRPTYDEVLNQKATISAGKLSPHARHLLAFEHFEQSSE